MKKSEITFQTVSVATGTARYQPAPKEITAFVTEPDELNHETGAMLFTHGWDCNRFMDQALMEYAANTYNVVCVSAEYRDSGYDFNPRTGKGYAAPYDLSFYQAFDSVGALRHLLAVKANLNRQRIFAYGLSQGGHITLLLAIFAPATFAFVNAAAPLTRVLANQQLAAGRDFSADELSIRDVIAQADLIRCPVYLEHGTADDVLPHTEHTQVLESRLKALGKEHTVVYHEGAGHYLTPGIGRLSAFQQTVGAKIGRLRRPGLDDFQCGSAVRIPCATKTLVIDWSQPQASPNLFHWEPGVVS